eukprot:12834599-Ditylum_brightwellii.AAC.1
MAQYIDEHYMPQLGNKDRDWVCSWAKKMLWDLNRAESDPSQGENPNGPRKTVIKYGIKVPWNAKHAIKLDEKNGNMMWQDAMALEVQE